MTGRKRLYQGCWHDWEEALLLKKGRMQAGKG